MQARWLAAAREALAEHAQSLAVLPMDALLDADDGPLVRLAAEGYQVQAPDGDAPDEDGPDQVPTARAATMQPAASSTTQ